MCSNKHPFAHLSLPRILSAGVTRPQGVVPREAGTRLCLPDSPGGPDVGNFLTVGGSHKVQPTGIKSAAASQAA